MDQVLFVLSLFEDNEPHLKALASLSTPSAVYYWLEFGRQYPATVQFLKEYQYTKPNQVYEYNEVCYALTSNKVPIPLTNATYCI